MSKQLIKLLAETGNTKLDKTRTDQILIAGLSLLLQWSRELSFVPVDQKDALRCACLIREEENFLT